jgi:multimeric flavodoxin WrbA
MKALIDRTAYVSKANGRMLKRKVGASVTAVRRSGANHAIDTMNHFFLGGEMITVGRAIVFGVEKGDVEKDNEGMGLLKSLGQKDGLAAQESA